MQTGHRPGAIACHKMPSGRFGGRGAISRNQAAGLVDIARFGPSDDRLLNVLRAQYNEIRQPALCQAIILDVERLRPMRGDHIEGKREFRVIVET